MPQTVFKNILSSIAKLLALLLLLSGLYILVTALSPQLPPPSADTPNTTPATNTPANTHATLAIPKIDLEIPFSSSSVEALDNGAWWRSPDSGNPKDGGNFVLSAHRFQMGWTPEQTVRKSPLYHIDKLATGDKIIVDYERTRYTYTITRIYQVTPDTIDIESPTDDNRLTLYTCTTGGASDGREVVIAHLTP